MRQRAKSLLMALPLGIPLISLFLFAQATYAHPTVPTPGLTATPSTVSLQVDGLHYTLHGHGFTPNTTIYLSIFGGHNHVSYIPITPDHVTSDTHGAFTVAVVSGADGSGYDIFSQTTVVAQYTRGIFQPVTAYVTLSVSIPTPKIRAITPNVFLDFGCVTLGLTGTGFIPSTNVANYAIIFAQDFYGPEDTEINVLGGGNIATSFQVCNVSLGQTIKVYGWDLTSHLFSNAATFHVVKL